MKSISTIPIALDICVNCS